MASTDDCKPALDTVEGVERLLELRQDGVSRARIGLEFGVSERTIYRVEMQASHALSAGKSLRDFVDERAAANPAVSFDAKFLRSQLRRAQDELNDLNHIVEQLAGFDSKHADPPVWETAEPGEEGRSILITHTSDGHAGEVVRPGEIDGLNEFNAAIYQDRMRRYYNAACIIGRRWAADTKCLGVLHTMAGDEIAGDIHEELSETNELTSHEAVQLAVETRVAGIRQMADEYGSVHSIGVPGNHGRTTKKPRFKRIAAMSYDMLIYRLVADKLTDDDRCTFDLSQGADAFINVFGRWIMVTHGDRIGTGGGKGFAGPVLPIIRGGNKVALQQSSAGREVDLILMGHYHTSAAPPGILANGSIPGYTELGNSIRARIEPPKQWLALYHEAWGLRDRHDVTLEPPAKSRRRVRVHAFSETRA
ncbi:MAG: hypothetical protein AAFQ81_05665 [Pseudomonadota bacterium]